MALVVARVGRNRYCAEWNIRCNALRLLHPTRSGYEPVLGGSIAFDSQPLFDAPPHDV
jgi:hypothetical protein